MTVKTLTCTLVHSPSIMQLYTHFIIHVCIVVMAVETNIKKVYYLAGKNCRAYGGKIHLHLQR